VVTLSVPTAGPLGVRQAVVQVRHRIGADGEVDQVALLAHQTRADEAGLATPSDHHGPEPLPIGQLRVAVTAECLRQKVFDDVDLAGRVRPGGDRFLRQHATEHLVDGPAHGSHGRDAQSLIDHGPGRAFDAGHHVGDLEGLASDASGQDVAVVSARHRGYRVDLLDPRLEEHVAVESETDHGLAAPPLREAPEGVGVLVDDRHGMIGLLQAHRQLAADPAAADDDHSHTRNPPTNPAHPSGRVGPRCWASGRSCGVGPRCWVAALEGRVGPLCRGTATRGPQAGRRRARFWSRKSTST
jgi:hypothetical protein